MAFLRKHGALLTVGVLIALAFYGAGFRAGEKALSSVATGVENPDGGSEAQVDFAPFWKAWNIINEKYVPASTTKEAVDDQEKVWGAIAGLAASLDDPYTVFFPPVES